MHSKMSIHCWGFPLKQKYGVTPQVMSLAGMRGPVPILRVGPLHHMVFTATESRMSLLSPLPSTQPKLPEDWEGKVGESTPLPSE